MFFFALNGAFPTAKSEHGKVLFLRFFYCFQYLKELLSDRRDLSTGMFVLSPWNVQTAELKNLLFQIRSRILTFFKNNVSVPGIILLYQYWFQEIC